MRRSINQNQPRKDSFYKTRKRGLKVIVNVICSEAREKTECNLSKKHRKKTQIEHLKMKAGMLAMLYLTFGDLGSTPNAV